MNDLVRRLRAGCVTGNYEGLEFIEWSKSNATMNEAAGRIVALENALRRLVAGCKSPSCDVYWIARAALEGKDG